MSSACACYVVDEGYLFPTLVSAQQARRLTPESAGDVVIACVGPNTPIVERVTQIAKTYGVIVLSVPKDLTDGMHIMFGRMFIDRFLPKSYERIVYIDGDTQVAGSLEPLLTANFPDDIFLACRDPATVFSELTPDWRKKHLEHHKKVGAQGAPMDYFNSGVLVINRAGWSTLAKAAVDAYKREKSLFTYPDQDALNVAVGDHCRLISTRWNFPGFLIGSPAEAERQPRIYHFMSNPRPWNVAASPWGKHWTKPYADLAKAEPDLRALWRKRPAMERLRYTLQQEVKMITEYGPVGRKLDRALVWDAV